VQEFEAKHAALANLNGDGAEFHLYRSSAKQQNTGRSGIVSGDRNCRFRKTGAPLGSNRHATRSDDRSETERVRFQSRVGSRCAGGLIDAIRGCPNLHLTGLMTMPPWSADPNKKPGLTFADFRLGTCIHCQSLNLRKVRPALFRIGAPRRHRHETGEMQFGQRGWRQSAASASGADPALESSSLSFTRSSLRVAVPI